MLGPSAAAAHLRRREAARGVRRARARARAVPARFLPSGALSCKNAPSPSPRGRSAAQRFAVRESRGGCGQDAVLTSFAGWNAYSLASADHLESVSD